MPKLVNYFVVEFRLPFQVEDVSTAQVAVSRARAMCENQFGFTPDNWYARVFEYIADDEVEGHVKEYFYNPNSLSLREITKNLEYHSEMVKKGIDPNDEALS